MRRRAETTKRHLRDRWVISYADFITLLFAFFVVMYAISSVDLAKLETVSDGVRMAFAETAVGGQPILLDRALPGGGGGTAPASRARDVALRRAAAATPQFAAARDALQGTLGRLLNPEELEEKVELGLDRRGFVISLAANAFFPPGAARLSPEAIPIVDGIGSVLETVHSPIRIEGHTDDQPIASTRFPSNWELSTARATHVLRHLLENFEIRADRVSAAGYASYRPLVPNRSEADRSRNRRIDVVILSRDEALDEPGAHEARDDLSHLLDQLPPVPED